MMAALMSSLCRIIPMPALVAGTGGEGVNIVFGNPKNSWV